MDLVITGFSQLSSAPAAAPAGGADSDTATTAAVFADLLEGLKVADCGSVIGVQQAAAISSGRETKGAAGGPRDRAVADEPGADRDNDSHEDDVAPPVALIVCATPVCSVRDADVPPLSADAGIAVLGGAEHADSPDCSRVADYPDSPDFSRVADYADSSDLSRDADFADRTDLTRDTDFADSPDFTRDADYADLPDFTWDADHTDLPDFRRVAGYADIPDFTRVADYADLADFTRVADHANPRDVPGVPHYADRPDFTRLSDERSNTPTMTVQAVPQDGERQSGVQVPPHHARAFARALASVATQHPADLANAELQRGRELGVRVDDASMARSAEPPATLVAPVAYAPLVDSRPLAAPEARRPMAGEHELVPQLVRAMRAQFRAGVGEARIRLNPEHLGEVRITITIKAGRVSALLEVERSEVQRAIESQSDSLRTGLAAQGFTLEHLSVSRDDRTRQQSGDDLEQRRRDRDQPMPQRRPKKRPHEENFELSDT